MLSQPSVEEVRYLGSTEREFDWVPGESDLDILVYGSAIPGEVERYGVLLIRDLNFELNLKLEDVPLKHPTPAYIDSPARTMLTLFALSLRGFTKPIRQLFKKYPPPLTHRQFWEVVENLPSTTHPTPLACYIIHFELHQHVDREEKAPPPMFIKV